MELDSYKILWPVKKQNGLRAEWVQEQKNRKISAFIR